MPDSAGKRQRREVKAKKATARDERRIARNVRRAARASGEPLPDEPIHDAEGLEMEEERPEGLPSTD